MAAISSSLTEETIAQNPDEILKQMQCFLKGSMSRSRASDESIIKSSIFLLQTVPAARQAVLEYLSQVFDEASALAKKNEHEKKPPDNESLVYENILLELQEVLQSFIKHNPAVWAPCVSSWSIELLGQISVKCADRRNMPNASNLNEMLQVWMMCYPTKILIEIVSGCFAVGTNPEVCVDALLEASVKYSPHFDWVVAHIGSCFPKTVINRVLMSGLEEYSHQCKGQLIPPAVLETKVPKMASVVGILGHLANHHTHEIQEALNGLFEASLKQDSTANQQCVVPFLLQVASLSPVLLRALTANCVKSLTPKVLNKLAAQYKADPPRDPGGLLNILVHIISNSSDLSFHFIDYLINMADPEIKADNAMETDDELDPAIKETCSVIMNWLVADLHKAVYNSADSGMGVPFLLTLAPYCGTLSQQLAETKGKRSSWLCRLLTLLAIQSSDQEGATVLSTLLLQASASQTFGMMLNIYKELNVKYSDLMDTVFTKVMDQLHGLDQIRRVKLVKNLLVLCQQEKTNKEMFVGFPFHKGLQDHLLTLSSHLVTAWSPEYSAVVVELISVIDLPRVLTVEMATKLSNLWVVALFNSCMITEWKEKFRLCRICSDCLQKLCRASPIAQNNIIRNLLQGVMSKELKKLFGSSVEKVPVSAPSSLSLKTTLQRPHGTPMKNQLQSEGSRSAFHSGVMGQGHTGVIGQGLRPKPQPPPVSKEQSENNKQIFMDTLWACCHSNPVVMAGSEQTGAARQVAMGADFSRDLALLVIELVAPDVMYNGMLWPEEDFLKVTMERDLQIKNKFQANPILWDIMDLVALGPGSMSYCSVLLKALAAVLLTFWESSRLRSTTDAPWQLEASIKLIDLMRKGGLLASPLSYVGQLFPMLSPYEVQMILASVWRFMKDNPPDPRCSRREGCHAMYLDTLRNIMQSNIAKMGCLYIRFFGGKPPS